MKILICDFIYLGVYLKLYTKSRKYMNILKLQHKYVLTRSTKNKTSTKNIMQVSKTYIYTYLHVLN